MKKLSKKVLSRSFWCWLYGNLTRSFREHMQTFGYMWSTLSIVQELYDSKDEQAEKLKIHYPFFNTEPQIGSIVVGMTAGLEETRVNGTEEIDDEMINGTHAGPMGPLADIGDSSIVGIYISVLSGITLRLPGGDSLTGPLFYIIVWNITSILLQKRIYGKGHELDGSVVEIIAGEQAIVLCESVIVMGQVIVGAVVGIWVSIIMAVQPTTSIQNKAEMVIEGPKAIEKVTGTQKVPVLPQEKLDGAFPGVLTLLFVMGCWWLMAKKGISPIKIMLLTVVIVVVGALVGFFNSGLSY